jgi:hypothetical protein
MDASLKAALIERHASEGEYPMIPIAEFFHGNDDLGSIGCNLLEHPGIEKFRDILLKLSDHSDVEAIFAQISELDPGADSWPFTDTLWIVGNISAEILEAELKPLEPDEIGQAKDFGAKAEFLQRYNNRVLAAWWD